MACPSMSQEDADEAEGAANPWMSHEDDGETDEAANPWTSHEGAFETDEIGASSPNKGVDYATGGVDVERYAGDDNIGDGVVGIGIGDNAIRDDHSDHLSDVSSDAPLDPEDDEELQALHERDFGSAGPSASIAAAMAPFVSLYPQDLPLTVLTKYEVDPSRLDIFGKGLAESAKRSLQDHEMLNSVNFQECWNPEPGDTFHPTVPILCHGGAVYQEDVAKGARWTLEEPSDPNSTNYDRQEHNTDSHGEASSLIASLPDGAKGEENDDDDRKPAASNLDDTRTPTLGSPVWAPASPHSQDVQENGKFARKRGRDANAKAAAMPSIFAQFVHNTKHEPNTKEVQDCQKRRKTGVGVEENEATNDSELQTKQSNPHNIFNYGKVTRMDALQAAGNDSQTAAFISSMLMDGVLKKFMAMSMWHQCNHSVDQELKRKGQVGPFMMWRTRHLHMDDQLHKHCVINSLCQIATHFQPEEAPDAEVKIDHLAASVSDSGGNHLGCVSYEVLVSNDVDRSGEIVELSSWVSKEAYWGQFALSYSVPKLQEARSVVDLFCDPSKQNETFWISNPHLLS